MDWSNNAAYFYPMRMLFYANCSNLYLNKVIRVQ